MKIKDLRKIIEEFDDEVELYYPHYYKGYGLIPVEKLDIGEVEGKSVGVFDWETLLLDDSNFIKDKDESVAEVAKRLVASNASIHE